MNERRGENIMSGCVEAGGSQRRRSPRLSSPPPASMLVKRSITVRKIAPRKTTAPSEHNKENTPRRSGVDGNEQKKQKVSTPGPVPDRRGSSSSQKKQKVSTPGPVPDRRGSSSSQKKPTMPSPILPSSPPPPRPQQPALDAGDAVWSQKVRRSYSRLSDKSFNSPESRESLFGFEKLQTPEVIRKVGQTKTGLDASGSLSGVNSFTSLLEAEDCGSAAPEPDQNIPGVALGKEKKRRRKVQQLDASELDAMAAKMNAEFEEAEEFELVVE